MILTPDNNYDYILPPNNSKIKGKIFQGGCLTEILVDELEADGFCFVISLSSEESDFKYLQGKKYTLGNLHFLLNDNNEDNLDNRILLNTVDYLSRLLLSGINIYIHCLAGVSRSSYLNVALHMRLYKWNYEKALAHIKSSRPQAQPNATFVKHLKNLESVLNIK